VIGTPSCPTLRDTLRLVRLMFDAPDARASPSRATSTGGTSTRLRSRATNVAALVGHARAARGRAPLRFVVDGTRWMPDPRAARIGSGRHGRIYSLLN
jgi:hypothetical protein